MEEEILDLDPDSDDEQLHSSSSSSAASFSDNDSEDPVYEANYLREQDSDEESEVSASPIKFSLLGTSSSKTRQLFDELDTSEESDIEEGMDLSTLYRGWPSGQPWSYMRPTVAPARVVLESELRRGSNEIGPQQALGLSSLRLLVDVTAGSASEDWHSPTEQNPLHLFETDQMLHIDVVDRVVLYLHAHSLLVTGLKQHTLIVRPSVYQMLLCHTGETDESLRDLVWHHDTLPSYVIVPVVVDEPLDRRHPGSGRQMHWYIWFGPVVQVGGGHEVQFRYLDSLPTPDKTEMTERQRRLAVVMTAAFPELKVTVYHNSPALKRYRQEPGSLDCGVFVTQAVSALLFEDPNALETPLHASVVRVCIARILSACKSGLMPQLAEGYRPDLVTLLHRTKPLSADGFYSVTGLAPSPLLSTPSRETSARPPPWQKQATKDYQSKLLIGAVPPLPRALSIDISSPWLAPSPRKRVGEAAAVSPKMPPRPPPWQKQAAEDHKLKWLTETLPPSPPSILISPIPTRTALPASARADIAADQSSAKHRSLISTSRSPERRASELSTRRFSPYNPASRRSLSVESGMSYVHGRLPPHEFQPLSNAAFSPFFQELKGGMCTWGVGKVQGVREREMDQILIGAFFRDGPVPSRLPPGISIVEGMMGRRPADQDNTLSIREFVAAVRNIESHEERDRAILTGEHCGVVLNLDWRKDSLAIEEDWLQIATDIDSLSLTVDNPQFTALVSIQLYPARATTQTSDNRLRVDVNGVETPLSHSRCSTYLSYGMC